MSGTRIGHQKVARLDVTVNNVGSMKNLYRREHCAKDAFDVAHVKRSPVLPLCQAALIATKDNSWSVACLIYSHTQKAWNERPLVLLECCKNANLAHHSHTNRHVGLVLLSQGDGLDRDRSKFFVVALINGIVGANTENSDNLKSLIQHCISACWNFNTCGRSHSRHLFVEMSVQPRKRRRIQIREEEEPEDDQARKSEEDSDEDSDSRDDDSGKPQEAKIVSLDLNCQSLDPPKKRKRSKNGAAAAVATEGEGHKLTIPRTIRSTQQGCPTGGARVQAFTGDILGALLNKVATVDFNCLVGCVAWMTNSDFVRALTQRSRKVSVSLIVQKEHFLKPSSLRRSQKKGRLGSNFQFDYGTYLQKQFSGLAPLDTSLLKEQAVGGTFLLPHVDTSVAPSDAVRCVGYAPTVRKPNKSSPMDKALPKMHHKFLLFCKHNATTGTIKPVAVWTGSFNFTRNATMSRENAVWIEGDEAVLYTYLSEWECMYAISEPLDWEKPRVTPQFCSKV